MYTGFKMTELGYKVNETGLFVGSLLLGSTFVLMVADSF